ncbi:MAG: hypothetical protein KAG99_11700 [Bacteroidales bacterium]|nr:hypothetical protein [Bacteroidales bacterium]
MEEKIIIDSLQNVFFSRGCTKEPKLYQKNDDIFSHGCSKLDSYDWLKDVILPQNQAPFDCIEVRFKNSRKEFFRITEGLQFWVGDIVAVESSPGHDVGVVTLTGDIVRMQMRRKKEDPKSEIIKKVYRKARISDVEKWLTAVSRENNTLFKARRIASDLDLKMKINDIEYQGDNTKAIFYYTAEERVDFRELIKVLAEEFRVRIEMRQIGARQESSRLGGIGTCGRELCCSTWLTQFQTVSTNTARIQQLSLNPQKLTGQCGKLKCCLNYEYDIYLDALQNFPDRNIVLKTKKGKAMHQKSDVFQNIMWYSYADDQANLLAIPIDKVFDIIEQNKKGNQPEKLEDYAYSREQKIDFEQVVGQDNLDRFDG